MKKTNFSFHLIALFIVTVLCALVYTSVQQAHRASANDPQLEAALDLKMSIEQFPSSTPLPIKDSLDIAKSLSMFELFVDKNGKSVSASGYLDGHAPTLPIGVLKFASQHGENMFTWQPRYGLRFAMVVEAVNSKQIGFVAAGRSLKEEEKRQSVLTTMVVIAWLACAGILILHLLSLAPWRNSTSGAIIVTQ